MNAKTIIKQQRKRERRTDAKRKVDAKIKQIDETQEAISEFRKTEVRIFALERAIISEKPWYKRPFYRLKYDGPRWKARQANRLRSVKRFVIDWVLGK